MSVASRIIDPDVRAVFLAGEANGTLNFRYATTPGTTKYYVFSWLDAEGTWHDAKMSKTQILGFRHA